jgi:hypothetical protein
MMADDMFASGMSPLGEEELWLNYSGMQFPPTINQTVVSTPLSDISNFDRDVSPGQSASTSSGIYGDFEDEMVSQQDVDEYEFIGSEY